MEFNKDRDFNRFVKFGFIVKGYKSVKSCPGREFVYSKFRQRLFVG